MLKLEFVGCGAGFSVGLGNNNAMIYDGSPENGFWLIDCGETTRVQLVERELINHCQGVIVTHLHGDHVYGLEMMGFWWRFMKHERLRLCCPSYTIWAGLHDLLMSTMRYAQDGEGKPTVERFETYFSPMLYEPYDFMNLRFPSGDVSVKFIRNNHVPGMESYAVELKTKQHSYLFTSDTREVMPFGHHSIIWHDCQLYDGGKTGVHPYIQSLKEVSDTPPLRRLWLMHYNRKPTQKEEDEARLWCEGFVKPGQVFDLDQGSADSDKSLKAELRHSHRDN